MKKNIILVQIAAMLLPLAAAGQNLDPTVEVSKAYEGKLMEVHKPQLTMEVPDSVLHFDLNFDYSVSETPYRGAYEFNPYAVKMKPSPKVHDNTSFYLRAGAGYQLHPVFDLVWSPKFRKPFRMNVYASHRSFVGDYWKMAAPESGLVDRLQGKNADSFRGCDLFSRAGVDGRYDWEKFWLGFDANYQGIQQKDEAFRSYYSVEAKIGAGSKNSEGVQYRLNVGCDFSEDMLNTPGKAYLRSSGYSVDGSLGYIFDHGGELSFCMAVRAAGMSGAVEARANDFDFIPRYVLYKGRWHLDLGLRISVAGSEGLSHKKYKIAPQIVYPDVEIGFMMIRNAMKLYLSVGGDSKLNTYPELVRRDHRVNLSYGMNKWDMLDVSEEKVKAAAGFKGRIGSRFSYDLRGGYAYESDALLDGVRVGTADVASTWLPVLGYGSYEKAFAALDWSLDTESVRFDGNVEYVHAWANEGNAVKGLFLPAALTGNAVFTYDWRDRIFVGVDCEFSTARHAYLEGAVGLPAYADFEGTAILPGYADLGLNLGYSVNRKFSVWARGGNLLNMTVQRSVLYAEKGPYFTLGITLNL